MTRFLDILLSDYRWYRRWQGGVWFDVFFTGFPIIACWQRRPPPQKSLLWHTIRTEDYATIRPSLMRPPRLHVAQSLRITK